MSFVCPIHGYYYPAPGATVALCPRCTKTRPATRQISPCPNCIASDAHAQAAKAEARALRAEREQLREALERLAAEWGRSAESWSEIFQTRDDDGKAFEAGAALGRSLVLHENASDLRATLATIQENEGEKG